MLPEMDGVILVSIPSEVSEDVVRKAVSFARKMDVPIFGIVENMSGATCPKCGEIIQVLGQGSRERGSQDMDVPFLGKIPLDPRVSETMDISVPFVVSYPEIQASKEFNKIVEKIEEQTDDTL